MYQCDATCEEILRWFHSTNCPEDLLILWLGAGKENDPLLQEVLQNVWLLDAVIQNNIAFMVIGSHHGESVSAPLIGGFAPLFNKLAWGPPSKAESERLAKSTQARVGEFATDLGVKPRSLPAFAIVTKHPGDVFVAPFRSLDSFATLKEWLIELQQYADDYRKECVIADLPLDLMQRKINEYRQRDTEIAAATREIVFGIERFVKWHPDIVGSCAALIAVIRRPVLLNLDAFAQGWKQLEAALESPEFKKASDHLPRTRINRAVERLSKLQRVSAFAQHDTDLLAAEQRIEKAYAKLQHRLEAFTKNGVPGKWVTPKSVKLGSVLPIINRQLSLLSG